jgi:hypothetical protein
VTPPVVTPPVVTPLGVPALTAPPAAVATPAVAPAEPDARPVRRATLVGARPGQLSPIELDRQAPVGSDRPIAPFEPEFGQAARMRSLVKLILLTVVVAIAFATIIAVGVEVISIWANHAISKSAGG